MDVAPNFYFDFVLQLGHLRLGCLSLFLFLLPQLKSLFQGLDVTGTRVTWNIEAYSNMWNDV
jgi:hypothetical protein